jgi:hypothetical protein
MSVDLSAQLPGKSNAVQVIYQNKMSQCAVQREHTGEFILKYPASDYAQYRHFLAPSGSFCRILIGIYLIAPEHHIVHHLLIEIIKRYYSIL